MREARDGVAGREAARSRWRPRGTVRGHLGGRCRRSPPAHRLDGLESKTPFRGQRARGKRHRRRLPPRSPEDTHLWRRQPPPKAALSLAASRQPSCKSGSRPPTPDGHQQLPPACFRPRAEARQVAAERDGLDTSDYLRADSNDAKHPLAHHRAGHAARRNSRRAQPRREGRSGQPFEVHSDMVKAATQRGDQEEGEVMRNRA